MHKPHVCVVARGIKLDRKCCACSQLAPHLHLSQRRAEPYIRSGELRRISGNTYQRTLRSDDRVDWRRKQSGPRGPVVLQMVK
jgi:hypothetical protein